MPSFPRLLAAALCALVAFGVGAPAVTAAPPAAVTVARPAAVPAGAADLTFATYNVCKADCSSPAPSWGARRDRVARVVGALGADVIGLQEATNQPVGGGRSQWQDLQRLVAPLGFVAPKHAARNDTCERRDCVHTARLLYRASTVAPVRAADGSLAAGYVAQRDIVAGLGPHSADREVAWAYLRPRTGGTAFLAVAMHLATEKDGQTEADRVAVAQGLGPWADALGARLGLGTVPVVLLADLNSFDRRQPAGAQAALRSAGWADAWKAPNRKNIGINSTNYSPTSRSGWPIRPIRNPSGVASRVDYVMFRGGGVSARAYQVMVWLNKDGSFVDDLHASDHNPVRARLRIAAPVPTS